VGKGPTPVTLSPSRRYKLPDVSRGKAGRGDEGEYYG
jgi:hypothetical protein